ncbi:MAG TPA: glycosyltransferase family 4 protein [Thermoanaerobaculia bacterium]
MPRVALIASHVIQYQDPFFRLLAAERDVDLTVLFCSTDGAVTYHDPEMQTTLRWDVPMLQGYRYRFLRNFGRGTHATRLINPGIVRELLFGRYDAAIFFLGWGTVTSLLGIAACRMRGLPMFFYGDSSFPPPEVTARQRIRAALLRALFGVTDGFLVSGTINANYYRHYGADPSRFFLLPWAIDNERFARGSRFAPGERESMRAAIGANNDDLVISFSAKLIPRKDPLTLLRAIDAMQQRHRAVALFLGHGELRAELEQFARERGVRAHFAGFVNQADLPKQYAISDVFVLPSLDEPRAAVVNEAMACGLPVIVSDVVGASGDIAAHGDNAFVFAPGDVAALAGYLDRLANDRALRLRMAQRSRDIIAQWTFERGVEGVKEALRAAC